MLSNKASLLALLAVASVTAGAGESTALRFSVPQGGVLNEFYRDGPVAAHLVLTSGSAPRLVIAFPAGNSGAAIWLTAKSMPLTWQPEVTIEPAELDVPGGALHGITATLSATGGRVSVRQAITGSVRVIREYEDAGRIPAEIMTAPRMSERKVVWQRRRIDGAPGYFLSVEVLSGSVVSGAEQSIEFIPNAEDRLRLRIVALTGEAPLTPMAERDLLTSAAAPDPRLRSVLTYLSFQEKLLAGSWRFDTYFGRDTLMSLRLLSPVLKAPAMEAGLGSVLQRLNSAGEVAHEEDIGEFAILQRARAGLPASDTPILDYKMIDDDFMLAPIAADYLLETSEGRTRATAFLAGEMASGESRGSALVRNFRYVVAAATPFAQGHDWRRLVALKPGQNVGNWRDSEEGLGGGRYPYDVNAVFVPAALDAIARLQSSGLLRPYLDEDTGSALAPASRMADIWRREAPRLFDVEIPADAARAEVTDYARGIGLDPSPAIAALGGRAQRFRAVSLDAEGRPVRVLVSDEAFALLFLEISSTEADAHCPDADAAVSGRSPDRRGAAGRESGVRPGRCRAGLRPEPLPRNGHLVVAAGDARGGHRTTAAPRRPDGLGARGAQPGANAAARSHRCRGGRARLGTVVMVAGRRHLSTGTIRPARRARNGVQRRAAMERCPTGAIAVSGLPVRAAD